MKVSEKDSAAIYIHAVTAASVLVTPVTARDHPSQTPYTERSSGFSFLSLMPYAGEPAIFRLSSIGVWK